VPNSLERRKRRQPAGSDIDAVWSTGCFEIEELPQFEEFGLAEDTLLEVRLEFLQLGGRELPRGNVMEHQRVGALGPPARLKGPQQFFPSFYMTGH
jgi:hypothetical protein